jgi:hypothetical protein
MVSAWAATRRNRSRLNLIVASGACNRRAISSSSPRWKNFYHELGLSLGATQSEIEVCHGTTVGKSVTTHEP